MEQSSRRSFLTVTGVGAAAVGAATVLPASLAGAATTADQKISLDALETEVGVPLADLVLVACVNDLDRGEVTVINGDNEITVTDHDLAQRIARLGRSGA